MRSSSGNRSLTFASLILAAALMQSLAPAAATAKEMSDESPDAKPSSIVPPEFQVNGQEDVVVTKGTRLVYFYPEDNDASYTALTFINSSSKAKVIEVRGYNYDGGTVYAQNITIPAKGFLHAVSDSVAAAPPPSWATPAPVTTNFTDFVYYATLKLPNGVFVEGYKGFNPGTGTINPRADQGRIPLEFWIKNLKK